MLAQMSRFLSMSSITAKPSVREKVRSRVIAGECLIDGCAKCGERRRGLCDSHYTAFLRELNSRPRAERADFEAQAIREGLILAVGETKEIKSPSPFANVG
jgi:hypothetical protein